MQPENNSSGDEQNANHFLYSLKVIRESTSYNENGFTTPPRYEFSQGNEEENNFTSEHLVSSVRSTTRVVPVDFDLKADQVFNNKKEFQEAVHIIALKYNF